MAEVCSKCGKNAKCAEFTCGMVCFACFQMDEELQKESANEALKTVFGKGRPINVLVLNMGGLLGDYDPSTPTPGCDCPHCTTLREQELLSQTKVSCNCPLCRPINASMN